MPSNHVCSNRVSPGSPHFRNQEPPRKQQLDRNFLLLAHVHSRATVVTDDGLVVVSTGAVMVSGFVIGVVNAVVASGSVVVVSMKWK